MAPLASRLLQPLRHAEFAEFSGRNAHSKKHERGTLRATSAATDG